MARSTERVEVLVVDDERVIREGLTRTLVSAGYDVRLASDGRAAFQAFLLERPDLVLLDVMMPGLDGYATCAEMRKIDREVLIMFLSALDSERDQIRGLEVGADDYVSKTASEAMLLARVKKALERAGRFSRIEAPAEMTKIQADIYRLLGSERGRFFSYKEILASGELDGIPTTRKFRVVRLEGKRRVAREIDYYNLEMIISVGYRVNSRQGVLFRRWATGVLMEYLLRGSVRDQRISKLEGRMTAAERSIDSIIYTLMPPLKEDRTPIGFHP